jgi:hypothetical protein
LNGEDFYPGASSLLGMIYNYAKLGYKTGKRTVTIDQNTGAANALAFLLDHYGGGPVTQGDYFMPNRIVLRQVFGGALTAITWYQQAYAPGTPIPNGKYAILGAWVNALTNYALIRFAHNDFGAFKPGFPVQDSTNTAVANAVLPKDPLTLNQGYQFVYLSNKMKTPVCPVFSVSNAGTGLKIEAISITTDTPIVILNLAKVS